MEHENGLTIKKGGKSYTDGSPLPTSFVPSDKDVVCGRARENFHHGGNRRFRELIETSIVPYLAARTKFEKSEAIARVVDRVQAESPGGGFVRKDMATGNWYQIGEAKARDKVGHAIRKAIRELEQNQARGGMKGATGLRSSSGPLPTGSTKGGTDDIAGLNVPAITRPGSDSLSILPLLLGAGSTNGLGDALRLRQLQGLGLLREATGRQRVFSDGGIFPKQAIAMPKPTIDNEHDLMKALVLAHPASKQLSLGLGMGLQQAGANCLSQLQYMERERQHLASLYANPMLRNPDLKSTVTSLYALGSTSKSSSPQQPSTLDLLLQRAASKPGNQP